MSAKRTLNNKKIIVVSKRFFISGIIFFTLINDMPIPLELNNIVDNALFYTIGKVAMEKLTSTLSKMQDDTATAEDWRFAALLGEITAVAKTCFRQMQTKSSSAKAAKCGWNARRCA